MASGPPNEWSKLGGRDDTSFADSSLTQIVLLNDGVSETSSPATANEYKQLGQGGLPSGNRRGKLKSTYLKYVLLLGLASALLFVGYLLGSTLGAGIRNSSSAFSSSGAAANAKVQGGYLQASYDCKYNCVNESLKQSSAKTGKRLLSFEDLFAPKVAPVYPEPISWLEPRSEIQGDWGYSWFFKRTASGDIALYNSESRWVNGTPVKPRVVVKFSDLKSNGLASYSSFTVSPGLSHVIFRQVRVPDDHVQRMLERRGRYNVLFDLYLWDINLNRFVSFAKSTNVLKETQYATFSKAGNLVTVRRGDIHLLRLPVARAEGQGSFVQLTFTGTADEDTVFNGIPDWVYEEEVFMSDNLIFFAPDNGQGEEHMAFLSLNDTRVPLANIEFIKSGKRDRDGLDSYSGYRKIRYPKAGYSNPRVVVKVASWDSASSTTRVSNVNFKPEDIFGPDDLLVTEVFWVTAPVDRSLFVRTMNRVQNEQRIFVASRDNTGNWNASLVRRESYADGAWIEIQQASVQNVQPGVPGYFELKENDDGWIHLCYFEAIQSKDCSWVTFGDFVVTEVLYIGTSNANRDRLAVKYISTEVESTMRHIYVTIFDLKTKTVTQKRLLTPLEGYIFPRLEADPFLRAIKYARESLSGLPGNIRLDDTDLGLAGVYQASSVNGDGTILQVCYRGPGVPFCGLLRHPNFLEESQTLSVSPWQELENNAAVMVSYDRDYNMPTRIWGQIAVPRAIKEADTIREQNSNGEGEVEWLNLQLYLPPFFLDTANALYKVPLLLKCYGGPNSQLVLQEFVNPDIHDLFASEGSGGVLVAVVDSRGTGFRGRAFRSIVQGDLGRAESQDQMNAAKSISAVPQLRVDEQNVGLWGWSYGGYLTLKTITRAPPLLFKAAVSVAPVTDWRFYDSVYTERYMGLPQARESAYDASAVFGKQSGAELASKFFSANATKVLIMHGLSDDNVHFQNTETVLQSLIESVAQVSLNGDVRESSRYNLDNLKVMPFPNNDHSISTQSSARRFLYESIREWFLKSFFTAEERVRS